MFAFEALTFLRWRVIWVLLRIRNVYWFQGFFYYYTYFAFYYALFSVHRLSLSLLYKLINKGHVEADKTTNTEEDADLFRNTPLFKKTKIKPKTLQWNLTITLQQNLKGQLAGGKWMAQLIVP